MKENDDAWLATWIQPRHLPSESIAASHQAFTQHPARVLVLDEVLEEGLATNLSQFLEYQAPMQDQFGLFSSGRVDQATWQAAPEDDRFYRYRILGEGAPKAGPTPEVFAFLRFRQHLQDPRLRHYFSQLTGLELGDVFSQQVHAMRQDDLLQPHNDHDGDRCLAFIFYCSADWEPAFGGSLVLRDRSGETSQITARANRLVLFSIEAHDLHWITPVTAQAQGRPRLSVGGWFSKAT